jgi:hypothetical protein
MSFKDRAAGERNAHDVERETGCVSEHFLDTMFVFE